MKKSLFPMLALMFGINLLVSCTKEEDPIPTVDPFSKMTRTIEFMNPESEEEVNYSGDSLQTVAIVDDENLVIQVDTHNSTQEDNITFTLDKTLFSSSMQKEYTIETIPDNGNGKVRVVYLYEPKDLSGSVHLSFSEPMNGKLIITDFDDQKSLISGRYEVMILGVFDPKATSPESTRHADISIQGEFMNIKLQ